MKVMSYNDATNINHDVYQPYTQAEFEDIKAKQNITPLIQRRLIATIEKGIK